MWIRRWLFWTSVFFFGSCAPSEKYLGPKQSPPISHNDLKKDGAQLLLSFGRALDSINPNAIFLVQVLNRECIFQNSHLHYVFESSKGYTYIFFEYPNICIYLSNYSKIVQIILAYMQTAHFYRVMFTSWYRLYIMIIYIIVQDLWPVVRR